MNSITNLTNEIKFNKNNRLTYYPKELKYIANGRSAYVFKLIGTNKVAKVFLENSIEYLEKEYIVYKKIGVTEGYLKLYEKGDNYLVLEYVNGKTLYEYLSKGIYLKEHDIDLIDEYLKNAINKGLNPNDIHLKNLMISNTGNIKVIDLARFLDEKKDNRWYHLHKFFKQIYFKNLCYKKIPVFLINIVGFFYKLFEKFFIK